MFGGNKEVVRVRRKTLKYMDRNDKTMCFKDGATALNRKQVQQCGISKKIRRIECNKSDSPHLRGRFLDWITIIVGGLISRNVLKLQSFNFQSCVSDTPGRRLH
jgi:hypothetical protein